MNECAMITCATRDAFMKGAIKKVVYTVFTVFTYEGVYTVFTIVYTVFTYEGVYTVSTIVYTVKPVTLDTSVEWTTA